MSGPFRTFWEKKGGPEVFVYPITDVASEMSFSDGKEYAVQYFERARFELHPEYTATIYEVQLGNLGTQKIQLPTP